MKQIIFSIVLVLVVSPFLMAQSMMKHPHMEEHKEKWEQFDSYFINSLLDELKLNYDAERKVYKILKDSFEKRRILMKTQFKLLGEIESYSKENKPNKAIEAKIDEFYQTKKEFDLMQYESEIKILKELNTEQKVRFTLFQKKFRSQMKRKIKDFMDDEPEKALH